MIAILFFTIVVGIGLGKIRIGNVRLGTAGTLFSALAIGFLRQQFSAFAEVFDDSILSFVSSLGTALFVSAIGLQTGSEFFDGSKQRKWKAFLGGVIIVFIGAVATFVLAKTISGPSKDIVLGLFAGSMTSTPTLSAANELCNYSPYVVVGYSMSYGVGLLGIMLFIQSFPAHSEKTNLYPTVSTGKKLADPLGLQGISIVVGILIELFLPLGTTGCVLLSSIVIGAIAPKTKNRLPDMKVYQKFGLIMFFVGCGIPAGMHLTSETVWLGIPWALFISLSAIFFGYFFIRYVLRLDMRDALAILCGGMTSTPAIGVLGQTTPNINLSLYSIAYAGALSALLISVQVLNEILA